MGFESEGAKYNHFLINDEIMLLGVNKAYDKEEVSILYYGQSQSYGGLEFDIMGLSNPRDREILLDTLDEFFSKPEEKKAFLGLYWDIVLDFLLFEKGITLNKLSGDLSRVIPGNYKGKSICDKLDKLKKNKGNPDADTLKLVELTCYYMGITKEIVEAGEGVWYTFNANGYSLKKIYEYCNEKWSQGHEIVLKDMIKKITGLEDKDIKKLCVRICVKEHIVDEKINERLKKFIHILIEQMNKK